MKINAGHCNLAARRSRRSVLMWKLRMSWAVAVWENLGRKRGIFSGLFGIIEVRPSAGVRVGAVLVIQREGKRWGGGKRERGDLVLGQVWFPLDQRPRVCLFVQAERPKGEQRQPDVSPPNRAAIQGTSAVGLSLLPLLSLSCFCTPPSHPPFWNKVQEGLLKCLRMFSVYVLFMRAVLWVPVRGLRPTVPEIVSLICEPNLVYETA